MLINNLDVAHILKKKNTFKSSCPDSDDEEYSINTSNQQSSEESEA